MKKIVLYGSTGSVGRSVLDVVRKNPDRFKIKTLTSNRNIDLLSSQISEFDPETAAIGDKGLYEELKSRTSGRVKIVAGDEELPYLSEDDDADIVFMAISGIAALLPLMSAIKAGKTIALASKEPIVSGGRLIMEEVERCSARIIPVDSEHSAIFQCIDSIDKGSIARLYITGSGGSLWNRRKTELDDVTVEEVLAHPKWDMGPKITVDSATLMNKGLEIIEARWLFGIEPEKLKVIIHPEAIIHSMVEFVDGTVRASMFYPDMRYPVLKALSHPEMISNGLPRVDLISLGRMSFYEPDGSRFPALKMAYEALQKEGTVPAVLNSANEAAVGLFLQRRIKFTQITGIVAGVIDRHRPQMDPGLEDIIAAERWAKEEVLRSCCQE